MFTGLVEETGRLAGIEGGPEGARLRVAARAVLPGLRVGDSVAVSGVCLTVVARGGEEFAVEAVPQTLRVTTLGLRRIGDAVNLERPLTADARLGGHIVQGHVDGVGRVTGRAPAGNSLLLTFAAPPDVARYIVERGAIAVDGVSLTVVARDARSFTVAVIPHTAAGTTLGSLAVGDAVNLEADVVAKYVEALAARYWGGEAPGGAEGR